MDLRKTRYEDVGRFEMAQDTIQWLAFVNTVMNLPVS
jgi:hypothetical protein